MSSSSVRSSPELARLDQDEVNRRLDRLFSFDHGEEYPHDHPPGDCRPIGGPMSWEEWTERAPQVGRSTGDFA